MKKVLIRRRWRRKKKIGTDFYRRLFLLDMSGEEPQFHVLSKMSHKLQLVSTMDYLLMVCSEYVTRLKEPCMHFCIDFKLLSLSSK